MNLFAIRKQADKVLRPLVVSCALVPLSANAWTLLGAVAGVIAAAAFYRGYWLLGLLVLAARGLLDHVDGYVARSRRQTTIYGAVLDDLSDRWVLGVVYAGGCLRLARIYPHLVLVFAAGVIGALSNVIIKLSIYSQTAQDQVVEQGKVGHPVDNVGLFGSAEFLIWFGVPILLMIVFERPRAARPLRPTSVRGPELVVRQR